MDMVFPGLRAMENIHPVVVHFPIVLLPLALLFQILAVGRGNDRQRIALWFLWLGTLGALAAATTGLLAEAEVEHPEAAHEVMELHKTLMLTTTGLGALLSMLAPVQWRAAALSGEHKQHWLFCSGKEPTRSRYQGEAFGGECAVDGTD